MKFFCEYCGNRIDSNIDSKCPHCGASYKKNETFKKLEEEHKLQMQKNKEDVHKTVRTFTKIFGLSFLMPSLVGIVIFITIIMLIMSFVKFQTGNNSFFDSIVKSEKNVTVGINEYGETSEYKVKVTSYEKEEDIFNNLDSGYEYIKFYLVLENKTNEEIYREDTNCIVNGIAQTNYSIPGHSTIPLVINKKLTVKGESTFAVPKDATSYDIRYGDYVTIHIEK